jgi:hypothetical protein
MLKRFQEKKKINQKFQHLIHQIHEIAKNNDVINLCAEPTGYSWLGVYNAGLSLFPQNTVAIPQYYSNQLLSEKQLIEIGNLIGSLKFEQLIFNGFNDYFVIIIENATKINKNLRVGVIHHGFPAELTDNPIGIKIFNSLISSYKMNIIHKIGFAKKGYADIVKTLIGKDSTFDIIYRNPDFKIHNDKLNRIGVLTSNTFRKNTPTQVMAALSIGSYQVAISSSQDIDFLDTKNLLVTLGHLSHDLFLDEMSRNIINSHITFSEASGGQVFTESLAVGVPCLTSLTHGYLDDSEELKKALVVDRFDDAWAIAQKMEEVIDNRDHLSKLCLEYSKDMNVKADFLLNKLLES